MTPSTPDLNKLLAEATAERDAWRGDDPQQSEAWCAGNNYVLEHLCRVLKVDPNEVDWDGSDNGLDDETDALILRILHHNDDDDGRSPAEARAEALAAEVLSLRAQKEAADKLAEAGKAIRDQCDAMLLPDDKETAALRAALAAYAPTQKEAGK